MRNSERDLEARRKAQALWDEHKKRDEKVLKEKDKERQAEAEKVARLRELRLAKEAADRKTAEENYLSKRKVSRQR
ncbi:MAG TPA: hypothetical protein VNW24_08980 [Stellaceae bacterium]|jgi:hypothetical protein|nr:hypothetical protein [Stellaceae bacterium]